MTTNTSEMFLSILNGENSSFELKNINCKEKYKSLKFESHSSDNVKFEYENGEIVIFFIGTVYNSDKLLEWLNISILHRLE